VLGAMPTPSESNPWGTPKDFSHVRYPRPLADCNACHEGTTYNLPLALTHLPTVQQIRECTEDPADPEVDELCPTESWPVIEEIHIRPETAVCTTCHDHPSVVAHAEIMTTADGRESCATCHGPGSSYSVGSSHGLSP
jgi:hypothetical protein